MSRSAEFIYALRDVGCVCTVGGPFLIRCNFVSAIRYSFIPARNDEQFCICNAPKLYRYSVNARENEHFCIGSKSDSVQVNAAIEGHGSIS